MSKTFLTGVNDVLERVGTLGSSGTLSSFTDSGRQVFIDLAKQIWNETIDIVSDIMGDESISDASGTITLTTSNREYVLPTNLVQIVYPLVDQTNGFYVWEYPGGYNQMREDQPIPTQFTGLPLYATINNSTGYLRFDRTPTSNENGRAYNLLYAKDLALSASSDVFPFADAVYRALVPVVAQGYEARKRNDFDMIEYRKNLSRAMTFANQAYRRTHW